jgi:hypothetical protein
MIRLTGFSNEILSVPTANPIYCKRHPVHAANGQIRMLVSPRR